ncbi:MAG: hypothetical protein ACXWPM_00715 [Bdellovibrionota bacterium]
MLSIQEKVNADANGRREAFPVIEKIEQYDSKKDDYVAAWVPMGGLTKRELFAAMAMQGIVTNDHVDGVGDPERHAKLAVHHADALLAELAKES